ncbi:sensor histidine kinase [Streptomyces sp. SP18CS02]|uniref:sensor histidine kinase n=1 Tax=Streptomyces sp. SP18CS02 TaxID=3002531 RepID=UPI002E79F023|nr:histidine kinase [Streptomyces sp. SP18CS02]MEE1754398.1 histidine kinase [Streptomyces sp. SP18CS02]
MDVSSKIRAAWRWLAAPELWSRRRTAGEAVLAVVIGLLAAGVEELLGSEDWALAAVGTGAAVLSLLRRRLPATVLVATGALTPLIGGFALLLLLVGWSAGRAIVGPGRALAAFTLSYAGFVGVSLTDSWSRQAPLTLVLLSTLYYLATTVMPGLASRYWTQRRTLLHALQERNAQLLRERAMVEGQTRLRERQRIAQDMHDSLGHQLALISVHTGALEVDRELTDRQREAVGVLRDASVTAMRELREVVGILRDGIEAPVADDPGRVTRGAAGIDGLVDTSRAAGNTVEVRRTGKARPLAPAADHAAYRIVQEALTNAYKHAPGAAIAVELRYEPDSLVVEVLNTASAGGEPSDVVSGGQGLTGLYERARLVGGMVHAGPVEGPDGTGFRVAAVLPYGAHAATGGPAGAGGVAGAAAGAPLVDAADDFRQQTSVPLDGNGGRVVDRSVWSVPERELTVGVGADTSRSRVGGVVLGCGIAVAALVVLLVAAGFGFFFLMGAMNEGMIEKSQYDAVKVGTSEKEVRDRLPSGDTIATAGLAGKGPAEPEGSTCLVLMSAEVGESSETEPVFRFCFKDGKLAEKKSYEVVR